MNYWIPVRAPPDQVVKYSQNERKLHFSEEELS